MNALDSTWGLEDAVAHRCIELIRRHAPRLMRAGGGPLKRECLHYGKKTAPEVRARIVALRHERRTLDEIATIVGRGPDLVGRVLHEEGVPHFVVRPSFEAKRREVLSRRSAGETIVDTAAAAGVGVSTVIKWCKEEREQARGLRREAA